MADAGKPVPETVDRFLARYISSIEQLEILLLLAEQPDRSFLDSEIAQAIYTNTGSVVRRLKKMQEDRLIAVSGDPDPLYTYAPETAELRIAVTQVARTYRERRVAVTTLIASRPMDNVRAFSDAFRLGKKEDS